MPTIERRNRERIAKLEKRVSLIGFSLVVFYLTLFLLYILP